MHLLSRWTDTSHFSHRHTTSSPRDQVDLALSDAARERSSVDDLRTQLVMLRQEVGGAQQKLQATQTRVADNLERIDKLREEAVGLFQWACRACLWYRLSGSEAGRWNRRADERCPEHNKGEHCWAAISARLSVV